MNINNNDNYTKPEHPQRPENTNVIIGPHAGHSSEANLSSHRQIHQPCTVSPIQDSEKELKTKHVWSKTKPRKTTSHGDLHKLIFNRQMEEGTKQNKNSSRTLRKISSDTQAYEEQHKKVVHNKANEIIEIVDEEGSRSPKVRRTEKGKQAVVVNKPPESKEVSQSNEEEKALWQNEIVTTKPKTLNEGVYKFRDTIQAFEQSLGKQIQSYSTGWRFSSLADSGGKKIAIEKLVPVFNKLPEAIDKKKIPNAQNRAFVIEYLMVYFLLVLDRFEMLFVANEVYEKAERPLLGKKSSIEKLLLFVLQSKYNRALLVEELEEETLNPKKLSNLILLKDLQLGKILYGLKEVIENEWKPTEIVNFYQMRNNKAVRAFMETIGVTVFATLSYQVKEIDGNEMTDPVQIDEKNKEIQNNNENTECGKDEEDRDQTELGDDFDISVYLRTDSNGYLLQGELTNPNPSSNQTQTKASADSPSLFPRLTTP